MAQSGVAGAGRSTPLLLALVGFVFLVGQVAVAGNAGDAETASHGKRHPKSSKIQLRELRAQLEAQATMLQAQSAELQALRGQVGALQGQPGAPATPTGAAGGDLTGSYPNPTIAMNAIGGAEVTDGSLLPADLNPLNVDGAAATPSLRTLGTGASQALAGNAAAGGDLTGTLPSPTIADDAVDSAALGATIVRQSASLTTLNAGESGDADLDCNAGETLLGGGHTFTSITAGGNAHVIQSIPLDTDTWRVSVTVDASSPVSASFRVRVVCLQ